MLEQAIISGIAHDTSEAKVTIRARARPARRRRAHLPAARGRRDQHRQIVQNTSRRRPRRHLVHAARERARRAPSRSSSSSRARSAPRASPRERDIAKVSVDRRRDEDEPGRRGRDLRGARRRRDQHRDHLDLVDPRLLRRAARASAERAVNVIHERLKLADVFYEASGDADAARTRGSAGRPSAGGRAAARGAGRSTSPVAADLIELVAVDLRPAVA